MNKKLIIGLGLAVATVGTYFFMKKKKTLTRREKYLLDAQTPGTSLNTEFVDYLKSTNNTDPGALASVIQYHGEDISGRRFNQFYTKTTYQANEIVRY